jgi:hypothetical protein
MIAKGHASRSSATQRIPACIPTRIDVPKHESEHTVWRNKRGMFHTVALHNESHRVKFFQNTKSVASISTLSSGMHQSRGPMTLLLFTLHCYSSQCLHTYIHSIIWVAVHMKSLASRHQFILPLRVSFTSCTLLVSQVSSESWKYFH